MRVYFIAVKGEHPEETHQRALGLAGEAVLEAHGYREVVARAWMEEMPDPVEHAGAPLRSLNDPEFLREQIDIAVTALEKIEELGRTDGDAAPLLVRAGDLAAAALADMTGRA